MVVERQVKVLLETGLHARPAALFVQEAGKFVSSIKLIKGQKQVDAKSIMGVMSLAVNRGAEITIRAEGSDAEQAIATLEAILTKSEHS